MNENHHAQHGGPNPHSHQSPQAERPDYSQPVAYDQQGNPLYAHPPQGYGPPPSVVHVARPINPVDQPISEEIMRRSEASRKKYKHLNLSRGEYIISAVRRHPIGLVQIWAVVLIVMGIFGGVFGMLFLGGDPTTTFSALGGQEEIRTTAAVGLSLLLFLILLGGMAATYIYQSNRFYLTNESVIQEIQITLFSKHEQTVSLSNIEDASYKQSGIIQLIFNYGTIRLSTEGDETTYRFTYVSNPKRHIAVLNNAVEAFKNGRPVDPSPNQDQPS